MRRYKLKLRLEMKKLRKGAKEIIEDTRKIFESSRKISEHFTETKSDLLNTRRPTISINDVLFEVELFTKYILVTYTDILVEKWSCRSIMVEKTLILPSNLILFNLPPVSETG